MGGFFRRASVAVTAPVDAEVSAGTGDILFKTGAGATVRVTIPNSGSTAIEIDGDCNLTSGNQYLVNGVPISGGGGTFIDMEIPTGTIDGVNAGFTLSNTPVAGSAHVYTNGVLQEAGATADYTIAGATITFNVGAIPAAGSKILVSYRL